ncbi:MAG TPA: hypothetical protein VME92_20700 [Acetobacteraceae bacterium]|nr:hypothetical protein [Acetobacteraceae bacterium]
MSGSQAEMDSLGVLNQGWGICGFTSSFYAVYAQNPGIRGLVINAAIPTRVLADIKTYLVGLKAAGNTKLLQEIEAFTRTFGVVGKCDFGKFTIDTYIERINGINGKSDAQLTGDANFSIAMPPQAVADYLTDIWQAECDLEVVNGGSGGVADGIIGVTKGTMQMYDGLCHYMYRRGNNIYSWGQVFNSVAAANKDFRVCRVIKIKQFKQGA